MVSDVEVEFWTEGDGVGGTTLALVGMPLKDIPRTGETTTVTTMEERPRPVKVEVLGHQADHAPDGTVRRIRLRVKELGR